MKTVYIIIGIVAFVGIIVLHPASHYLETQRL